MKNEELRGYDDTIEFEVGDSRKGFQGIGNCVDTASRCKYYRCHTYLYEKPERRGEGGAIVDERCDAEKPNTKNDAKILSVEDRELKIEN